MIEPSDPAPDWLDGTRGILLALAVLAIGALIGAGLALIDNLARHGAS
jgi:hypothetical protein